MDEDKLVKVKLTRTQVAGGRGETGGSVEQYCVVELLEKDVPDNGEVVPIDTPLHDWRNK